MRDVIEEPAELARFVKKRRAELGMTQEEAAQQASIGVSTWRSIEKGEATSFRDLTLARAARALDVAVETLISVGGQSIAAHAGARPWSERPSSTGAPDQQEESLSSAGATASEVVWRIAPRIARLSPEDAALVEALVVRLSDEGRSST